MTDDLFRKEALKARSRSLTGDVVLRSRLPGWIVTLLLMALVALVLGALLGISIETEDGRVSLLRYLLALSQ